MIYSMTSFARAETQGEWGSATCELKSVNHRYLDLRIHLPEFLSELEQPIQEYIRQKITRGKLECYLRLQPAKSSKPLELNEPLIEQLVQANQAIAHRFSKGVTAISVNAMDILQWPGVLQSERMNAKEIQQEMMKLIKTATDEFLEVRHREGLSLKNLFLGRINAIRDELKKVRERLPTILKNQRERILKYFQEAQLQLDNQRLEQEMVIFTQKIDVMEEIERIDTHVTEVCRVLEAGGVIGRRLDFLMQELNREANTLGSKSVDVSTTHAALEIKVLVEQLREQMQNIE